VTGHNIGRTEGFIVGAAKRRSEKLSGRRARALGERVALARELAASPTVTVTLRIPARLNEWLDGYVHGAWPKKVRKQELVAEGLRLLVARRGGPGEACLSTDLIDEGEAD
jgi:hypothetical protein